MYVFKILILCIQWFYYSNGPTCICMYEIYIIIWSTCIHMLYKYSQKNLEIYLIKWNILFLKLARVLHGYQSSCLKFANRPLVTIMYILSFRFSIDACRQLLLI